MSDIRKRVGKKGTTYQVRYPNTAMKSGYAYKTFDTLKEARAWLESGEMLSHSVPQNGTIDSMSEAVNTWLRICEKEGLNGRDPVTAYTLKNYQYRADFIKAYRWDKPLQEMTTPDIVAFRSWLLQGQCSRVVAGKVMATLHSLMKEMTLRGVIPFNVVTGVSISAESRYREPVTVPSRHDVLSLLEAADRLADSKNVQIARTWDRYRPILYLAVDSGMRPQEYLAITRSDLDAKGVHVNRAIDGSGHSITVTKTVAGRRYIELSDMTLDLIRHYSEHHTVRNEFDLIFPASNGRWLCRKNWQRRGFNAACREAGLTVETKRDGKIVEIPKYRPYDLRHFFASRLIEKNTNLKKIQNLMGHTNIETTLNVYGHLLEGSENAKIKNDGLLSDLLEIPCGKSVARNL